MPAAPSSPRGGHGSPDGPGPARPHGARPRATARVGVGPARGHPGVGRRRVQPTRGPPGLAGDGRALPDPERERLEPLLGLDLSTVRVHAGPPAESLAATHRAHALAYGSHVVLGRSAQRAGRHARTRLLAHELTHVGQQAAAAPSRGDARFDHPPRGPPVPDPALSHVRAPLAVQRLPDDDDSILPAFVYDAAGAVGGAGSFALETALETGGAAVDFALESAASVVEYLAPGLLDFLRGGALTQLGEMFCSGIDTLLGGLFSALGEVDFMSAIETTFTDLAAGVRGVQSALGGAARSAIGFLLEPLVRALQQWGGPLIDTIQSVSDSINGFLSGMWENIGVPVLDFLETVGGEIWATFTGFVGWIWDLTAPLRNTAERAWTWLLEQFDLAWDSTSGVRTWLAELAADAWAGFLETIEPIREPLMVAAGVLLLLSPLGPIVVLTEVVPPLWEKLTWLWNNWNSEDILVRAQDVLREDILPGVIGLVGGVAAALGGAASWLAGVVASLGGAMSGVLGAFGASRCLRAVTTYLDGVADQFDRLAAWAKSGFAGLKEALLAVFDALVALFQPILDFLVRLAMVVVNPFLLPVAIAAGVWLLCPEELKPPVINFVLDLLIAAIAGFPAFLTGLGPLASVMKAGVLGFLRHLRSEEVGDQLRIDASNKIANLAAGGGLQFIAGLALGLVHGLIDGIIDPFRLIFLIAKAIGLGVAAVARAVGPFMLAHLPGLATGVASSRESVTAAVGPSAAAGPAATASAPAAEAPSTAPVSAPVSSVEGSIPEARGPPVAPPAVTAGAPAAQQPAAEELVAPAPGDLTDAQIVAGLSPGTLAEAAAGGAEPVVDEAALEGEMRGEVQTEGATVGGLARLLGGVWDAILAGAENLGARAAGALLEHIMLPDFQLGRKIGFVAGFVLLQALIIYFTAGTYSALKIAEGPTRQLVIYLLRFLDLGGELFAVLGRALRPLRGPLLAGLGAARGFLGRFRFARGLVERVERLAARLFGFADEGARAARESGEAAPGRLAGEAGEAAPGSLAGEAGERAPGRAAGEAGERAPVRAADDLGEGGLRAVDEPGVPTVRDDALRATQQGAALVEARGIAELNDALGTPVALVLPQLMALKRQFRWIDTFTARMLAPGVYRLELVASPGIPVDEHYTPGAISIEELRGQLPGVVIDARSPLRMRALEFLNELPPTQREEIIAALRRLDPDEAGRLLREIGRLDNAEDIADALLARQRRAAGIIDEAAEGPVSQTPHEAAFATPEGAAVEPGATIIEPVTRRVNPERIRAGRRALRDRMRQPGWANDPTDWNAHHIIPVELQDHAVFDALTSTRQGWNHHDPLVNGIALPTNPAAATRSGLPVHQVTPDMLRADAPPGVIRDLQGHPNVNRDVKAMLDALEPHLGDPVRLRQEVLRIRDALRNQILTGGRPVLF